MTFLRVLRAASLRGYSTAAAIYALCSIGALPLDVHAANDPRLIEAVKAGDRQAVRTMLAGSRVAGVAEVDGTTPLHWAVRGDDADMVAILIKAGADVKAANRYGMTPITLAAINGNASMIRALLDAGADPNSTLPQGETVLMTASRTGSDTAIKVLLDRGANPNAHEPAQGETALMWAVAENHPVAARALIAGGADVNAYSAPASIPKLNFGTSGIVPMSMPKGRFTPLMFAARQGAIESAAVLLAAGADVNLTDPEGTTALLIAIMNAHYDTASLLLDWGADPEIADDSGMAALYDAVDMHTLTWMQGRPAPRTSSRLTSLDLIAKLLDYGADPNAQLKSPLLLRHHALGDPALGAGSTPLMRAAKTGDVAAMRLLLAHGADPDIKQKNGTTMIILAAGLGWRDGGGALPVYDRGSEADAIEMIKLCLEHGADINEQNAAGDTAMHGAAVRGADAIIKFLVDQGAKVDVKNKQGRIPLEIAQRRLDRSPSTVALLNELMKTPGR